MHKHIPTPAIIATIAAIAGGTAVAFATETSLAPIDPVAPISCSIEAVAENGAYVIEAKVASLTPIQGNFSFKISGGSNGNNSQIRHGGSFQTHDESPTIVGRVRLGADNAVYNLDFNVASPLGTDSCDVQLGL